MLPVFPSTDEGLSHILFLLLQIKACCMSKLWLFLNTTALPGKLHIGYRSKLFEDTYAFEINISNK